MKTFRKIGLALIAIAATLSIFSCSKDDEPNDGGNGNGSSAVTVDGQSVAMSHVFWYIDDHSSASEGYHYVHIEFYSYDPTNPSMVSKVNFLSIDYEVPKSQTTIKDITLDGGDYDCYLAFGVTMNDLGWQGQTWKNETENTPFTIKMDGNKVSIKIDRVTVYDNDTHKTISVNYNGPIKELPENLQD